MRALLAVVLSMALHQALGQPAAVPRIGYLGLSNPQAMAPLVDSFRAGLRELGYVEGKNIVIEQRWAQGDYERVNALAAELVKLKPQLLLTQGTDGTRAAKLATTTIPIVMIGVSDPTVTGLVDNIARPSGNVTGLAFLTAELNVKRLEFLSQALPQAKRFALLVNPDNTSHPPIVRDLESTARALGLELQKFEARRPADFASAFDAMAAARMGGVVIVDDGMFNGNIPALSAEAMRVRLPSITTEGGMITYSVDRITTYRRAAWYVDRILKGSKPGDLAIERVANYQMVVNRKVADQLGVQLPQTLLLRADRVIE